MKIALPLLAAVFFVTGACGASAAKDERRAQRTPTAAGEATERPPSAGSETSPPDSRPDLTGTITAVKHRDQETNPSGWILVEEDPDVEYSAGPDTAGWEKLVFEVTDETRLFVRRGGDGGKVVPATATDLAKGQTVDAWHGDHAVMESYPGQTVASRVVIHGPPPAHPEVFSPCSPPNPQTR